MKYFPFVVWMLLFPLSMSIVDYINKKTEILVKDKAHDSSDEVTADLEEGKTAR